MLDFHFLLQISIQVAQISSRKSIPIYVHKIRKDVPNLVLNPRNLAYLRDISRVNTRDPWELRVNTRESWRKYARTKLLHMCFPATCVFTQEEWRIYASSDACSLSLRQLAYLRQNIGVFTPIFLTSCSINSSNAPNSILGSSYHHF